MKNVIRWAIANAPGMNTLVIGMLLLGVLPNLYDWARMQLWQPVSATVVSASLNTHRGSKSGSSF